MSGHKQLIIDTCKTYGVLRNQAAYILATVDWETNHTFKPVKEGYWLKNAERWRKRNLRYWPWYGRGFVQLTWERNYVRAGKEIGVDLITNPDLAMVPANAVKILVVGMVEGWFTGKKLSDYITLKISRFTPARRIINGTDKASTIAKLARKYDKELRAAGYGETGLQKPASKAPAKPRPEPTFKQPEKPKETLLALFLRILSQLFKR